MLKRRIRRFVAASALVGALLPMGLAGPVAASGDSVVYDAIPSPLPPNAPSQPFQAQQTSEFGDYVHLAGTDRLLSSVTIMMSDWALFSDYTSDVRYSGNSATWTHPITVNVYASHLGGNGVPDTLLATVTQTITIPWRPAEDPINCPTKSAAGYAYKWQSTPGPADTNCNNGLAFNATFDFSSLGATLTNDVIVGVVYNTQSYGATPIGSNGPYNSLNVAVPTGQTASVGTDDSADKVFWNTSTAAWYTDGGSAGVGIFRQDTNWTPYGTVAIKIETTPQCTTVCYVNDATGNDANSGDTPATAKKTIQAAINQVDAGGQVRVLPGVYNESAPGSNPTTIAGTYQFGLFFGSAKAGITLMGVNASDVPVTNPAATLARINTDATNSFGTDGIFVEAANTTIQGVEIGPNLTGDNKTIEVVADNFTLKNSHTAIPGGDGSIYIDDFSVGGTVVKSYHVTGNLFDDGTSVDISSGAGNTGPVSGREILNNTFDLVDNGYNGVSFNGTGGVAWFANPVGGAIIKNNSFSHSTQYIRARGVYDNTQFDWESFWNDNTFDKATVALVTETPFDVQTYAYDVFTNVRRIGGTIQQEVDHAVAGDTVLAKAGAYPEVVSVPTSLTIKGAQAGNPVSGRAFGNAAESTVTGQFTVTAPDVTIDGFSITSPGLDIGILLKTAADRALVKNDIFDTIGGAAASAPVQAIYLENGPDDVKILNNRISNVQSVKSAKGIYVGDTTATNSSDGVVIEGNSISNIKSGSKGAYGIQANNKIGTVDAVIKGNSIDDLGGGWAHAIGLEGKTPNVNVNHNVIGGLTAAGADKIAVWFEDDPSFATGHVNRNSLAVGSGAYGILAHPALGAGPVDGTCNWWGAANGPSGVGLGSGSLVGPSVTFSSFLGSTDLDGACDAVQGPALHLVKTASPATYSAVDDVITYDYIITNTGNVTISSPFTIVDNKATVTCPSGTYDLSPGVGFIQCAATHLVTQPDLDAGSIVNKATATGKDPLGHSVNSNEATATVTKAHSAMTIEKSADPGPYAPYQPVTYSYKVTNTGNTTLTGIVVKDDNGTPSYAGDDFTVGTIATLPPFPGPGNTAALTATVIPVVSTTGVVNGATIPAGSVIVVVPQGNGDIKVTYLQAFGINDNTYGTGAIGYWPATKIHKFSDLTGSDKLEFRIFDKAGNVVLDFYQDYLSASGAFPSGYGSLCASGGDGFMVSGLASNIRSCTTSLADNFNILHNVQLVNSPTPTGTDADGIPTRTNWDYRNSYTVVIKGTLFGSGSAAFGSVAVPDQHNSPNKLLGPNGMATTPRNSTVVNTATATSDAASGSLTATATATVQIVVPTPINQPPLAVKDNYKTNKNKTLTVAAPGVLKNDTDPNGDALTATLVSITSHGTLTLNANGSFTYIPAKNFTGSDSFTYKAKDATAFSNVVTVTIKVDR